MNSNYKKNSVSRVNAYQLDEIDIFQIFTDLWSGKIPIILVTLLAGIIGAFVFFLKPNSYEITTNLNPAKNSYFTQFTNVNVALEESDLNYSLTSEGIFKLFIKEFNDYTEIRDILSNQKIIGDQVLEDLNDDGRNNLINALSQQFRIIDPTNHENNWQLQAIWDDPKIGIEIFSNTLNYVKENIKNLIIQDLSQYSEFLENQNKQKIEMLQTQLSSLLYLEKISLQKRIIYLSEQAAIAKELGIIDNSLDEIDLINQEISSMELNINTSSLPDYLRGYKALEKEKSLLLGRSDEDILILSDNYRNILSQIEELKKDILPNQLKQLSENIKKVNPDNWVEYDFEISSKKNLNQSLKIYILISSIIGGFLSSFWILLAKAYANRKK